MIVYPARHLFEAKFPKLEDHEEEIFFQHPVHEIKINQLGVLYYDESVYAVYEKQDTAIVRHTPTRRNCGSKIRIIWECYTGELAFGPHFLFVNGNPLDLRWENIRKSNTLTSKERDQLLAVKRKFTKKSVEHLIKIEERAEKLGMDITELHKFLLLPHWLVVARAKNGGPGIQKLRLPGGKSPTTEEEADEIEKLYLMGLTFYAIINRFGWTSTHRVKKVVRDRGLVR
jgi:hypothetical protein